MQRRSPNRCCAGASLPEHSAKALRERKAHLPERLLSPEQILDMLAQAPARLASMTSGITEVQLHTPPGPGEWSANEVLAHLRACADMWGKGIATILAEDYPTIGAINPRTWIESTDYLEQKFHAALRAFTAQRKALLATLRPLPHAAWSRAAKITGAGKPFDRTVHSYAQWLATHERPHLKQIQRIVETLRAHK